MLTKQRLAIGLTALAIFSAAIAGAGWFFLVGGDPAPAGKFDISDRKHSAFRISFLVEEVLRVERSADPIELAKGAVALERIELMCNNFEIHADLDSACDHLLQARGGPSGGLRTELEAATQELRSVMSRRERADFEVQEPWDADITEFRFDHDFRQAVYDLMIAMIACDQQMWTCNEPLTDERVTDFLVLRFQTAGAPPEDAQARITYLSTRQLADWIRDFTATDHGKFLIAPLVVLEINKLGIR